MVLLCSIYFVHGVNDMRARNFVMYESSAQTKDLQQMERRYSDLTRISTRRLLIILIFMYCTDLRVQESMSGIFFFKNYKSYPNTDS